MPKSLFIKRELRDAYWFSGFVPGRVIFEVAGDVEVCVIGLTRCLKKWSAGAVVARRQSGMIVSDGVSGICPAAICVFILSLTCVGSTAATAAA